MDWLIQHGRMLSNFLVVVQITICSAYFVLVIVVCFNIDMLLFALHIDFIGLCNNQYN